MARMRQKWGKDRQGKTYFKGYYAEFYDRDRHPRQKWVSLGTRDEQAARQTLAKWEFEYAAGTFDPWQDGPRQEGVLLSVAIDRFLKDRRRHCTEKSVGNYEETLRAFAATLPASFPLYGVEPHHVEKYLAQPKKTAKKKGKKGKAEPPKPRSEATKKSYRDRLRIFFEWTVDARLRKGNPVATPKRGKKARQKALPRFLTEEEFEAIVRSMEADALVKKLPAGNRWLIDATRFAVGTGLRRAELCALRWSAIDIQRRTLRVENVEGEEGFRDFTTKSGRERLVPLVGDALAVVKRLAAERSGEGNGYVFRGAEGDPLAGDYCSKRFKHYARQVGLPKEINWHSLRHTFCSWWVQRGGDLYMLKEVAGHASIRTTMQYAHLRPDGIQHVAERLFGDGHPSPAPPKVG